MSGRPWHALLYWPLALAGILAGAFTVAYATFLTLGPLLDQTSLNTWGDAEGLVLPFWIGFTVLVVAGLAGAWVIRRRRLARAAVIRGAEA